MTRRLPLHALEREVQAAEAIETFITAWDAEPGSGGIEDAQRIEAAVEGLRAWWAAFVNEDDT